MKPEQIQKYEEMNKQQLQHEIDMGNLDFTNEKKEWFTINITAADTFQILESQPDDKNEDSFHYGETFKKITEAINYLLNERAAQTVY